MPELPPAPALSLAVLLAVWSVCGLWWIRLAHVLTRYWREKQEREERLDALDRQIKTHFAARARELAETSPSPARH